MATITVCGTASRQVQPDYVVVSLGLGALANDAPAALDQVAEQSHRLVDVVSGLGLRRDDWVTEGVSVNEEFEWRNDAQVSVGYRARSGVVVTLRSAELVGALLRDAVGSCAATVRDLMWRVDAHNPVRHTVMGDAVRDAQARAMACATALGVGLGQAEVVSDQPLHATGGNGGGVMAAMEYGMRSKAGADQPVEVSGGLVTVSAEVYVRFGTVPAR